MSSTAEGLPKASIPEFHLVQCPHPREEGGSPGQWFILGGEYGRQCHQGPAYGSQEEARKTLELHQWLSQALDKYQAEEAERRLAMGMKRPSRGIR